MGDARKLYTDERDWSSVQVQRAERALTRIQTAEVTLSALTLTKSSRRGLT